MLNTRKPLVQAGYGGLDFSKSGSLKLHTAFFYQPDPLVHVRRQHLPKFLGRVAGMSGQALTRLAAVTARVRAKKSCAAPLGNGTTSEIGRAGKVCAAFCANHTHEHRWLHLDFHPQVAAGGLTTATLAAYMLSTNGKLTSCDGAQAAQTASITYRCLTSTADPDLSGINTRPSGLPAKNSSTASFTPGQ